MENNKVNEVDNDMDEVIDNLEPCVLMEMQILPIFEIFIYYLMSSQVSDLMRIFNDNDNRAYK